MDLLAFLDARIAEDEELAAPDPDWDDYKGFCDAVGVHYDKARVLAECAAKRAIIADYQLTVTRGTLLHLASVYRDHPAFNSDWI